MIAQATCEGYFSNVLSHDQNLDLQMKSLKKESVANGENYLEPSGSRYIVSFCLNLLFLLHVVNLIRQ